MEDGRDESRATAGGAIGVRGSSTRDSVCDERGLSFVDSHQECVEEEVSGETSRLLTKEPVRDSIGGATLNQESSTEDPSHIQAEAMEGSRPLHHSPLSRDKPQTEASHQSADPSAGGQTSSSEPQLSQSEKVAILIEAPSQGAMPSAGGQTPCSQPLPQVQNSHSPHHKPQPQTSSTSEKSSKSDVPVAVGGEQPVLMESMAKLLQAQTQMLAAQAQAVTAQGFPPLKRFAGEHVSTDDENFERWLEQLEERVRIASWSKDQQLYQLKMHLEGTALQVFRMLAEKEKVTYDATVQKLKEHFRPIDIEELKGIEFHQKVQADESIEQLGIDLQTLGRKAFPQACGREFDRLLKGRFFQALRTKWQRKLGAPKPDETFYELYDRARTLERHEQQYNATASCSVWPRMASLFCIS